ncbi:MAG: helix-turn-helix transcriptional regulator [Thaumarchaeota archaeon]|nr:helix-turn-helix transcriptional regulator [Nitrososphaerota archaeon]MDE1841452.1 helix-turn-helix transcriptional regulator [Nitrososphaerota archaeon]
MEEENLIDKNDPLLKLEDSIEILTTDDERLKVIGEEISNETGRAVLSKLFEGVTSVSAIASSLDVSMQLVGWHIQRLSKVGLITVMHIEKSSKNKEIQHYKPKKFALVILPSQIAKSSSYSTILKKALTKTFNKLPVFATFAGSSIAIYLTQKILNLNQIGLQMSDPTANRSYYPELDLLISLAGGITIAFAVWLALGVWKNKSSASG